MNDIQSDADEAVAEWVYTCIDKYATGKLTPADYIPKGALLFNADQAFREILTAAVQDKLDMIRIIETFRNKTVRPIAEIAAAVLETIDTYVIEGKLSEYMMTVQTRQMGQYFTSVFGQSMPLGNCMDEQCDRRDTCSIYLSYIQQLPENYDKKLELGDINRNLIIKCQKLGIPVIKIPKTAHPTARRNYKKFLEVRPDRVRDYQNYIAACDVRIKMLRHLWYDLV